MKIFISGFDFNANFRSFILINELVRVHDADHLSLLATNYLHRYLL